MYRAFLLSPEKHGKWGDYCYRNYIPERNEDYTFKARGIILSYTTSEASYITTIMSRLSDAIL